MSEQRRTVRWRIGAAATAIVLLVTVMGLTAAMAGPVGTASGFEDDDANLIVNSTFDWNGFDPTTWTGTAPYQVSEATVSGWKFGGATDAQATNSDTGFAGGTKQDNDCASVVGSKAPNKDDLKRIYLSSKTVPVNGVDHVFLNLAWVRITQNTTSPSAHVAFEFNKGTTPCPAGSDGLVRRTAGDMLVVYDFEGGAATPVLTLRRWVTSGACEISSNSAPCWGVATNLTALSFAEAKVNTTTQALDTIAPTNENLGLSEFGEAGIDLTAAGVFTAGTCQNFGKAYGVSRSSGNSGTAQMKDLVGPLDFTLQNCGTVIIRKETVPAGGTGFPFTSNVASNPADATAASFSLDDDGVKTINNVLQGSYNVTETVGSIGNYTLTSIDCTAGDIAPTAKNLATGATTFTMVAGGTLDCTYTNTKNKNNPSAATSPTVIPQDSATITGLDTTGVVDGAANKELTFKLFDGTGVGGNCTGTVLYSKTVTVTANTTYNTDNSGVGPSPGGYTITGDETDYWQVVYKGDSRNNGFTNCNEVVAVDLTASP